MKPEELKPNAVLRGIVPDGLVAVVLARWHGSDALQLLYRQASGAVGQTLLFRDGETRLELAELGRPFSLDGDGAQFRLVSEAHRIQLAHLFDPVLAVHNAVVDPLPHHIFAVYESMLLRKPLHSLLPDAPNAGKAVMEGRSIGRPAARDTRN